MAFFDDFTASLKKKWLEYFQLNHSWMTLQMEVDSVKTPDGGRRPPSYLILGVLNAIEPKLAQLMFPFSRLNSDPDSLIDVLELNFDPDIALGNRPPGKVEPTPSEASAEVGLLAEEEEEATEDLLAVSSLESGAMALDDFGSEASDESSEEEEDAFGAMALADFGSEASDESSEEEEDAFGVMALDDFGSEASDESSEEEEDAFGAMALADFDTEASDESAAASLMDMEDISLDAWDDDETASESKDESLADLGDISFLGFGEESSKKSDDDDLDAFGDMTFEELGEVDLKDDDDVWKK
ncbi:DUF5331 domain-containing protein [Microseira wollei]|uniref:DUF5331 domain-containing protein n=1 Tax=Microseira wollei NIES-4236 TaxID=2530354 RepID=A0AAV3X785_9CYAN|nr:DUF5331 domain-containing protein [Microseira wollei]GET38213.1 hypothetical protein MiSe_29670 [Microseira wollei NIES-4236]